MIDIWVTMHDLCLSWVFSLVWNVYDIQSSKLSNPKSVRVGEDGLRPTMGLEGGPGAWWRTRMLPSPFTVLLLSVDKLEAAAGQPAVWQGAGDIPPARRCPNHFYTSSVPRRTRDSRRCFQPARQLSEIQEAALLLSKPDLGKWSSYLPIVLLSKSMLVALIVQTQFLFFLPRVLCGHRC